MIIPNGTEIEVDVHGQLSIRTPGNLVLQNSGNYGTIESLTGSIRIEPHVQVEAVEVKCADVCYIQGSLTAWKVRARAIELEETARAHIILQETESLQIGREARLVGNFSSENELFLLFSRFAKQMRSLPFGAGRESAAEPPRAFAERQPHSLGAGSFDNGQGTPVPGVHEEQALDPRDHRQQGIGQQGIGQQGFGQDGVALPGAASQNQPGSAAISATSATSPAATPKGAGSSPPTASSPLQAELSDSLFFALVLLEREAERPGGGPTHHRIVGELLRLLRDREIETLRRSHETLWSQLMHPSDDLRRARELVVDHFG